ILWLVLLNLGAGGAITEVRLADLARGLPRALPILRGILQPDLIERAHATQRATASVTYRATAQIENAKTRKGENAKEAEGAPGDEPPLRSGVSRFRSFAFSRSQSLIGPSIRLEPDIAHPGDRVQV